MLRFTTLLSPPLSFSSLLYTTARREFSSKKKAITDDSLGFSTFLISCGAACVSVGAAGWYYEELRVSAGRDKVMDRLEKVEKDYGEERREGRRTLELRDASELKEMTRMVKAERGRGGQ